MKLTPQRTLSETINFLLALLFVIPLGVLIEQLCGYPLFRCCLVPATAVLGHMTGRLSMRRSAGQAIALCIAGVLLAALSGMLWSWGLGTATALLTMLSAGFALFFYFTARKAAYTIYAPMAIGGILLHLVILLCCEGFHWDSQVRRFTSAVAICFFLLTLFSFSAKGLRKSLHRSGSDKGVAYPRGMQMGNFLLVTGFILIAALISNIYPIFHLFSRFFSVILAGILAFVAYLSQFFYHRTLTGADDPQSTVPPSSEDNIMNVAPRGEAGWVTQAVEIFAFLCVVLVLIYAAYRLCQKLRASGVHLPGFLRNLRDRFAPVEEEDYVDEAESLFDLKEMLSDARGNVRKALKKLRERPQRLEDFQDPRMKIRFVFQQLLKKAKPRDPGAASMTPNELNQKDFGGQLTEFMDYYNQARYSDAPLPQNATQCAKTVLKEKG